ncbi:DNA polymerase III subunit alpha [Seleniivibrio woodruffii]|uniref:DNA polymerase III subunit alpha n=1 Tax=Seleniivibrio woodruffii TaxID=1078050 RepID=A0A4R1KAR1_9BACT|nr:DNA polymerase III subunit alpha [Seleniivibrio woodruffii]TCK61556.1 DNA polymerase-3 subunit alpha [Seleniivibrio woodruffii]TVZ35329.1 DNA polymerase III, alpha subunit [Seleniivibrio woodruffii]
MSQKKDFVHLHLHTQYSLLDGAIIVGDLMKKIKTEGSTPIVGISDHGTMHGIVDFYKQALANDIKPILGCEVYVAPDTRKNTSYEKGQDRNYHLVLQAKNNKGLSNLQKLVSKAQFEGFHYKPRIDKEILAEYSEGLIGMSACLAGEIPRKIMRDRYDEALAAAMEYRDILGKDDFFLEIQENGIEEQMMVNRQIIRMSKETGIPLVATNDCHYLNRGDHLSHQVLICIQTQSTVNSPNKFEIHSDQLWVKSPEEMWAAFAEVPSALTNTVAIAERCNTSIEFGNLHLPEFEVPEGYTIASYLTHLSRNGLVKKLAKIPADRHEEYHKRLQLELDVIIDKHFAGYFLIVWDFINHAHTIGVPVGPGRGSGAGSLVAYALGITDIDPIRFKLLFERFLNPERASMPDFDIDFCVRGREEVIKYVRRKYGDDRVSQIITFGKLLGRSTIRDVGRVLEVPLKDVDKLAKALPGDPGMTLRKALEKDPSLNDNFKEVEQGLDILNHAVKLEGLVRNTGMHAAGVVISDKPLNEYVPLCKGQNDEVITQFEKDTLEAVGLVKFDFLGLNNLTIIDEAIKRIRENRGIDLDISKIPLDDKKVYDLLTRGDTTGVFQLESSGMKNLLKKLKPEEFEDIIALVALYRPGPMESGMLDSFVKRKWGEEEIDYIFPQLEEILKETRGVVIYQEQVMQIAQIVAGYSLGSADNLRRAMGKKKASEMEKQKEFFLHGDGKTIPGAKKMGFDMAMAEDLFDKLAKFAGYGFNKSHSAAYAMVSYQTAYLKANFPVEYMAAILSCEIDKGEKIVTFTEECKSMGIEVHPPDINRSGASFVIDGNTIRFGLGAIKNVGMHAIEAALQVREEGGEFKNIYDYCARVDLRLSNKKVLESLVKAGAFDSTGKNRRQNLQVLEKALEEGQRKQKMEQQGIISLESFLEDETENGEQSYYFPDVTEMPENELLKMEKEVLDFYISNHPLAVYNNILKTFAVPLADVKTPDASGAYVVGGLVKAIKNIFTKKGDKMAFVTIEDMDGELDVVVFPKVYEQVIRHLVADKIIIVAGNVNHKDEEITILADAIMDVPEAVEKLTERVTVKLTSLGMTTEIISKLKTIIRTHKGDVPVSFYLERPKTYGVFINAGEDYKVKPDFDFYKEIDDLIGKGRYEIKAKAYEHKEQKPSFFKKRTGDS